MVVSFVRNGLEMFILYFTSDYFLSERLVQWQRLRVLVGIRGWTKLTILTPWLSGHGLFTSFSIHVDHKEDYRTRASLTFILISRVVWALNFSTMLSSWYYELVLCKQRGIRVDLQPLYLIFAFILSSFVLTACRVASDDPVCMVRIGIFRTPSLSFATMIHSSDGWRDGSPGPRNKLLRQLSSSFASKMLCQWFTIGK
jgi:hypothetical protein